MKKRFLVLLTAVAMLMAMLGMSDAPAFGAPGEFTPTPLFTWTNPDTLGSQPFVSAQNLRLAKSAGFTDCVISAL
jgi:hypothetical protein